MEFDESLSTVHAYLCADGYVIKNPDTQKQKYYYIGFRNTNLVLLKDFQKRFREYFGIVPRLIEGERCVVQNKELYEKLIRKFGSFYPRDWKMPSLDNKLDRKWLRAFFDCEGWVFCKHHQNRHIGLDSINEEGIDQVVNALNRIGIKTIKIMICPNTAELIILLALIRVMASFLVCNSVLDSPINLEASLVI